MPRKLYDPQLTPEREVVAMKETIASTRANRLVRTGEQYIATCMSGHHVITSDASEAEAFADKHHGCPMKN